MSVRRRIVVLAAGAVAVAVLVASAVVYLSVRSTLRGQVDDSLRSLAPDVRPAAVDGDAATSPVPPEIFQRRIKGAPPPGAAREAFFLSLPAAPFGGATGYAQVLTADGDVLRSTDRGQELPITDATRAVAAGERGPFLADETVGGVHLRVFTVQGLAGDALQVARPLTEVDDNLSQLLWILLVVGLGGAALAGGLGLLVARRAMRPVEALTETAEHVAATQDLSRRLPADPEGDELARLGASFNAMLGALEDSRAAQRQLVADASHELRTPLTSVLTNVEHLARMPASANGDRAAALGAATAQLHELDVLIEDLVDLARPEPPAHATEDVRLDELATQAVERAALHAPEVDFQVSAEPVVVRGLRARLHRAVGNLLDNAVKHGPPGGPVGVTVRATSDGEAEVIVDDHGPGIPAAERAHAFDRFWRSDEARGLPGSGLGLAIVRHVAETHGGSVAAGEAPGGGARLTLRLPSQSS